MPKSASMRLTASNAIGEIGGAFLPCRAFAAMKRHNEVLWEIWVAGFEKAVKLRPAAWQKLLTADHETAQAMSGILTLADVDRRDSRFHT
jgi:hypothetical protein